MNDPIMSLIEYVGIIAFAASGAILAVKRKMDLLGVIILAVTTSLGGGFVRDLMLGITPPWMFIHSKYALMASIVAVCVFIAACFFGSVPDANMARIDRAINVFDSLGLAVFAISGVDTAINCGYADNAFLCVFVGTLSAVGGGVLRDMFSATVPFVLQKRIYALAAIAGAMIYYYLSAAGHKNIGLSAAFVLTVSIRLLAARYRWRLPRADSFHRQA